MEFRLARPGGDRGAPGGDPHLLDEIHQIEPWLLFLRHELRAGRLPFWNPHQHAGEPYWSNGQTAPLFPLHLLFAALPPDTIVMPGHGDDTTIGAERPHLQEWVDRGW